ncbi:hypothetical protein BDV06DRAFT_92437 [Aspergillus oleicola]
MTVPYPTASMEDHYRTAIEAATTAALAASNAASQAATAAAQYANALACRDIPVSSVLDEQDRDSIMEEYATAASVAAIEAADASENARRAAEIAVEAAESAGASAVLNGPSDCSSQTYVDSLAYAPKDWCTSPVCKAPGCNESDSRFSFSCQYPDDKEWIEIQGSLKMAALEYLEAMLSGFDSDSGSDDSSSPEVVDEWAALKNLWKVEDESAHAEYISTHLQQPVAKQKEINGTRTPVLSPLLSCNENKKLGDWTGGLLVKHDKHRTVHSAYGKITEILTFKTLVVVEETPNYPASQFQYVPSRYLHDMAGIEYSKPVELGGLALGLLRCNEPGNELKYGFGKVVAVRRDASIYLVSNGMEDMGVDVCDEVAV